MESCWICVKVGYWNLILHVIVVCSVLSVNTGTEPKVPIPNFLGTEFLQEPIGTDLLRNRICMGTEEPNRSGRYYRMPRVNCGYVMHKHKESSELTSRVNSLEPYEDMRGSTLANITSQLKMKQKQKNFKFFANITSLCSAGTSQQYFSLALNQQQSPAPASQ